MPDLAKSLGKFFYRDVFYIVAGMIILLTASQVSAPPQAIHTKNTTADTLLLAAFAYAVGLLNQEIWSQLPFVKTCVYEQYPRFLRNIYRRHMGEEWVYRRTHAKVTSDDPDYQRTINLKQIGSALGTSLLTGSAFQLYVAASGHSRVVAEQALVMLVVGILFILMSWLHNMRQAAFQPKVRESLPAAVLAPALRPSED